MNSLEAGGRISFKRSAFGCIIEDIFLVLGKSNQWSGSSLRVVMPARTGACRLGLPPPVATGNDLAVLIKILESRTLNELWDVRAASRRATD